jgi:hypothetical protein
MRSNPSVLSGLYDGLLIASTVNLTSADVNGTPSCHFTPSRSFHVTSIPPSARSRTPPLSSDGTSAARSGTTFIFSSVVVRPSMTQVWMSSRICVLKRFSVSGSRS